MYIFRIRESDARKKQVKEEEEQKEITTHQTNFLSDQAAYRIQIHSPIYESKRE